MIESLKAGESFKLVCDENPNELVLLLKEAAVPNLEWRTEHTEPSRWSVILSKKISEDDRSVGCCGLCGGDSKEERGA